VVCAVEPDIQNPSSSLGPAVCHPTSLGLSRYHCAAPNVVLTHRLLSLVSPGGSSTLETLVTNTVQTSYLWTINLPSGTLFNVALKDSTGTIQDTSPLEVVPNPSGATTCTGDTTASASDVGTTTPPTASLPSIPLVSTPLTTTSQQGLSLSPTSTAGQQRCVTPCVPVSHVSTHDSTQQFRASQFTSSGSIGVRA
jgi:hypothetical protein